MSELAKAHTPIPLYSQDSILDIPKGEGDDRKLMRDVGRAVLDIIRAGDRYSGDARINFITDRIRELERA